MLRLDIRPSQATLAPQPRKAMNYLKYNDYLSIKRPGWPQLWRGSCASDSAKESATKMKPIRINDLEKIRQRARARARQFLPMSPAGLAGRE
jgi:hypothetical protein